MYEEMKGRPLFLDLRGAGHRARDAARRMPTRRAARGVTALAAACGSAIGRRRQTWRPREHDHPLRRRLRHDRRRLARHRRAGRGPAPVGHQRHGQLAALAGDRAAPARAPRPSEHRAAPQSDARGPAGADAAAGAWRARFPGCAASLLRALLGLLDGGEIRAEIERQLDRFEAGAAISPRPHRRASARPRAAGCAAGAAGDGAAALSGTAAAAPRSVRPAGAPSPPGAWRAPRPMSVGGSGPRLCARGAPTAACRSTTALPASPTST